MPGSTFGLSQRRRISSSRKSLFKKQLSHLIQSFWCWGQTVRYIIDAGQRYIIGAGQVPGLFGGPPFFCPPPSPCFCCSSSQPTLLPSNCLSVLPVPAFYLPCSLLPVLPATVFLMPLGSTCRWSYGDGMLGLPGLSDLWAGDGTYLSRSKEGEAGNKRDAPYVMWK